MGCGNQITFFRLGTYIIRSDKIIALSKEFKNKQWCAVILYDSPHLKSLTHPCGDEAKADDLLALMCRGSIIDIEKTLESFKQEEEDPTDNDIT